SGVLWVGYRSGKILRLSDGKAQVLDDSAGVPAWANARPSLAMDSAGRVWLGMGDHLGMLRESRYVEVSRTPGSTFITASSGGGIWALCGSTLCLYDEKEGLKELGKLSGGQSMTGPMHLYEDRRGALWIGTGSGGLFRYDDQAFENVATPQARVTCIAEDAEGNVWA